MGGAWDIFLLAHTAREACQRENVAALGTLVAPLREHLDRLQAYLGAVAGEPARTAWTEERERSEEPAEEPAAETRESLLERDYREWEARRREQEARVWHGFVPWKGRVGAHPTD